MAAPSAPLFLDDTLTLTLAVGDLVVNEERFWVLEHHNGRTVLGFWNIIIDGDSNGRLTCIQNVDHNGWLTRKQNKTITS